MVKREAKYESSDSDSDGGGSGGSSAKRARLASGAAADADASDFWFDDRRVVATNGVPGSGAAARTVAAGGGAGKGGTVVYWMQRDQRARDNWALLWAADLARRRSARLVVCYTLLSAALAAPTRRPVTSLRSFAFGVRGLAELRTSLRAKNIAFHLLRPSAAAAQAADKAAAAAAAKAKDSVAAAAASARAGTCAVASLSTDLIGAFARQQGATHVVTDFSPLREARGTFNRVAAALADRSEHGLPPLPLTQIDAWNVIPVRVTSDKQEWAARTIRPKIHRLLSEFTAGGFPPLRAMPKTEVKAEAVKSEAGVGVGAGASDAEIDVDTLTTEYSALCAAAGTGMELVAPVPDSVMLPGETGAAAALRAFCEPERLKRYANARNDPNDPAACSGLSPWFRHGQLSPQAAVTAANALRSRHSAAVTGFIEEAVVRRELSENFVFFQPEYDNAAGAPNWVQLTHAAHKGDKREYVYTERELECAVTHDDLWNAAQLQVVTEGKLHGFLRMYWAKKILEWTPDAPTALRYALLLNDKYNVDGGCANGYVGCMWSVYGVHDTAWAERTIFGKVRYMNYNGCKRKFDVAAFVRRYAAAAPGCPGFLRNKKLAGDAASLAPPSAESAGALHAAFVKAETKGKGKGKGKAKAKK